jgi:short-subunit dehydrogenase
LETVLVTGGASGIGRELVRLFIKNDCRVIVFSLVQEELDDLSEELSAAYDANRFFLVQADLSQPHAAQEVFDWCVDHGHEVDILVNNAGFSITGEHADQNIDHIHDMLSLNMVTLAKLSLLFGKKMKEKRQGKILNIGSTTGISPVPLSAAYAASKSFVNSLSTSLAMELKPYGVIVSCMEPYLTKTKFVQSCNARSVGMKGAPPPDSEKQEAAGFAHSAEKVARYAYEGLKKRKTVILPDFLFVVIAGIMRALPQSLVAGVLYKLVKRNL